jgi:EAL domain-containing protein (putative c-di-GMP-specific phosphodiesterase class I)/CheY-like chemotaxis protein
MNVAHSYGMHAIPTSWKHRRADGSADDTWSAAGARPRVLFVDDEPHVLAGLRRALSDESYRIETATSADEALQKLLRSSFDVVVSDERMPGMPGSELLTLVAREFPTVGRILLTGHGTLESAARAINDGGVVRFLLKPCPAPLLRDAIEAALRITPFENRARAGRPEPYTLDVEPPVLSPAPEPATSGSTRAPADSEATPEVGASACELSFQAQKVVDLNSEALFGYELTTRLQTQTGNVRSTSNLVSASGQHFLLASADRWVLRHVLTWMREHQELLERDALTVSLNIATQSLADAEFVDFLDQELSDPAIASRFLIEVREAALAKSLRADQGLLARLLGLRCYEAGARLCIDGVAGALWKFAVLKNLPVALAKIDSRFVCNVLSNNHSEYVVRSAVEWGAKAAVDISATGIDTRAVAARLIGLGVRFGQGSFFGTPEPTEFKLPTLLQ